MDAWNYLAFGGLERIVIIGAATLIGYWGYRIFAASRGAGLTLMTAAALVLVGALLTTGTHLDRVNDTLVASHSAATPEPVSLPAAEPVAAPAALPKLELKPTADADLPLPPAEDLGEDARAAGQDLAAPASADGRIPRLVPLASGQELGGRITSVRSENVTIEWSPEVARRRVISSSREP